MKNFWKINQLYLSELLKRSKLFFLYRFLLILLAVVSSLTMLYFPKFFFDAITEKKDFQTSLIILVVYGLYLILNSCLVNFLNLLITIINDDVKYCIRQKVIARIYQMPYEKFDTPQNYDQIQRALEFVDSGNYQFYDIIAGIVSDVLSLCAVIYVLSQLNWWVLLFLAVAMLTEYMVNRIRDKEVYQTKRKLTRSKRGMNYIFGIIGRKEYIKDLRINHTGHFIHEKFEKFYRESREETIRMTAKMNFLKLPTSITDTLFTCGLYGFLGWDLFLGKITMGSFTMLLSAATNVKALILTIQIGLSSIRQSTLEARNFYEIFEADDREPDPPKLLEEQCPMNQAHSITFEHVRFTYPGQGRPVIDDLSFSIAPDEKVVFVGENGAGKSTIIKLILGLYQPDCGRILIDGIDLREWEPETLYQTVSVVFQDHMEFAFTIAENILMNNQTEDSIPTIHQALETVGLKQKVLSMPLQEKTPLTRELSEDGIDISGGERQKLAIARAYAKKGRLLIMDEPSSSLDVFTESELFGHLTSLSRGQTAILITHRVISLQQFDRIFYVEAGGIPECGSHDELIQKNGRYKKMFDTQSLIFSKS